MAKKKPKKKVSRGKILENLKKLNIASIISSSSVGVKLQSRVSKKKRRTTTSKDVSQLNKKEVDSELKDLMRELRPILQEANKRAKILKEHQIDSYALYKAETNKLRDSSELFSFKDLSTREDVIAETTRAVSFLNDQTSTVYGANKNLEENKVLEYLGEFGKGYYNESNPYTYSKRINHDYARVTFKAYRMLEEMEQIRIQEYGSDYMISYMYSLVEENGINDITDVDGLYEIVMKSHDFLESQVGVKNYAFEESFKDANSVTGLLDYVEFKNKFKGR